MRPERHGVAADAAALRAQLRHVYWIGGGSCAGKSVIARRIAARHGLRLYATDDVMPDHGSRCAPGDCPFLSEFAAMDMDERWVNRSPETMLETFHWFRGEGFGLIVEELVAHNWPTYRWLPTTTSDNMNKGIILRSARFSRRQLPRVYLRYRFRFPLALPVVAVGR